MRGVCCQIRRFVADDGGATAIEYGLIAGLIAIGALVAMSLTGTSVISMFDYVSGRTVEQLDNIEDI
ncbi:Flp family type IVb pilin [Devosia sp. LjRoot16]|uniref:Flp family type IVb pilin n=1 Tax=Devosia sp. LjRoot16 TaxID=3342271 RepID=UPI003ECC2FBE